MGTRPDPAPIERLSLREGLRGHRNSLGILRLVLATLVIFSHAFPLGGWGTDPGLGWSKGQESIGGFAVVGFFAISGYLIAKSGANADIAQFMWRRMLRIFPAFWLVLLVAAGIVGPIAWMLEGNSLRGYLSFTAGGPVSYLLANTTVGSRVPLDIIRDGRRQTIQAVVGQRPSEEVLARQGGGEEDATPMSPEGPVAPGTALGLSLQALTPQIGRAVGLPENVRGVIVTAVDPSSDAAQKGVRRGDLIMSINRQPVTTPQALLAGVAAARTAGRSSVLLLVKRGRAPEVFIGIEVGAR